MAIDSNSEQRRDEGGGKDFVTLAEALALYPLLPVAEQWNGPDVCTFDIVGKGGDWRRIARFRLFTVNGEGGRSWRRWVIQNQVLMDGTDLEQIADGAINGVAIDANALLMHEKFVLQRRVDLLSEELRIASDETIPADQEIGILRGELERVLAERDALARDFERAQHRLAGSSRSPVDRARPY